VKVNNGRLAQKLRRAADRTPDLVERARIESAEDLLAKALPRTPLSAKRYESDPVPGQLRASGYADHESHPDASEVGFSASYAPIVHAMPEDNDFTTPGTGPRFLEGPLLENRDEYARRIKDAARKGLHG
jgi:hypothetical protein